MMTYFVIAALSVIVVATVLFLLVVRSYYRRYKNLTLLQIKVHLHALLKRGYDGGFLIIQDIKSEKFVQFAKYIKEKDTIGLELGFPKAPWSEIYYDKLKDFLQSKNIHYVIQSVNSKPVTEFIDVDCHADIDLALKLVEGIFCDVFQIKEPSFKVRGEHISAKDELIDS